MTPTAIVLAGGVAKRFPPIVTPKVMFPFFGEPVILSTVRFLKRAGLTHIVLVGNPDNREQLQRLTVPGLTLEVAVQPDANGMADAILHAAPLIHDPAVFVVNATDMVADSLADDLKPLWDQPQPALVAKKMDHYFPGGYLQFSAGRLTGIVEKPGEGREPSPLVNLVFHYLPDFPSFVASLQTTTSDHDDVYEKALSRLISATPFKVIEYAGPWQSLKYAWHILPMTNFFLRHRLPPRVPPSGGFIHPTAVIDDNVYIGPNVKVFEYAVVKGPAYLGDGVIVGTHALVREAIVEAGAEIGAGCEVARSYVGRACRLHQAYVGDSVLENHVNLGAGAVTANWRFDEKPVASALPDAPVTTDRTKLGAIIGANVKIGVHATIFPGTGIGTGCVIGPAISVRGYVPPDRKVYQ